MATAVDLQVDLIAHSHFDPPTDLDFINDSSDADSLIEFAGRACYETWNRPNPHTATNDAYIRHIMDVGHVALLEHPTATFYIRGLSRLCSHELIRHRHFSFSQLSQRFVPEGDNNVVVPPAIASDPELTRLFVQASDVAREAFGELLDALNRDSTDNLNSVIATKQARQAARTILPGATETRLVVTGNFRTWRHFIGMRAIEQADLEIRRLAIEVLRKLQNVAPHAFSDFTITELADGSHMATSPYVSES